MHKFLKIAIKAAQAKEFDEQLVYTLASVLVRGGNILSIGFNKPIRNGFVEHFTSFWYSNLHAEMAAVYQARDKSDLTGCKMYTARLRYSGTELGIAKPCKDCVHVMQRYGIKRAYYTMDEDSYGVMRL